MATRKKQGTAVNPESTSTLVFIGWSGKGSRSEKMALMLREWLGQVIQTCEPWYSEFDIASGAPWNADLMEALQSACFGILCVTPENYMNPWLNYECGVLVGRLDRNVCPLVLDEDLNVLRALPLARQMAKSALNRASVLQVVQDINKALGPRGVPSAAVESSFDAFWSKLDFATLPQVEETTVREPKDKLDEILSVVQALNTTVASTPMFKLPVPPGASPLVWGDQRVKYGDNRIRFGQRYFWPEEDPTFQSFLDTLRGMEEKNPEQFDQLRELLNRFFESRKKRDE